MPTRQRVTQETIERAIKARLAKDCDVGSPCMARRVLVEKSTDDAGGSNWRLATGGIPIDQRDAYAAAAGSVALSFDLL